MGYAISYGADQSAGLSYFLKALQIAEENDENLFNSFWAQDIRIAKLVSGIMTRFRENNLFNEEKIGLTLN